MCPEGWNETVTSPMRIESAVGLRLDGGALIHARPQQRLTRKCRQIGARTAAGVIAMGVRNQRAIDRDGRVDMEIPGGAVQAGFANLQKRHILIVLRAEVFCWYPIVVGYFACHAATRHPSLRSR